MGHVEKQRIVEMTIQLDLEDENIFNKFVEKLDDEKASVNFDLISFVKEFKREVEYE